MLPSTTVDNLNQVLFDYSRPEDVAQEHIDGTTRLLALEVDVHRPAATPVNGASSALGRGRSSGFASFVPGFVRSFCQKKKQREEAKVVRHELRRLQHWIKTNGNCREEQTYTDWCHEQIRVKNARDEETRVSQAKAARDAMRRKTKTTEDLRAKAINDIRREATMTAVRPVCKRSRTTADMREAARLRPSC